MAKQHNPFLTRANEEQEFTLEQLKEIDRCSIDPVYFIKKYCKVQHPTKGSIPFELYDYQVEMIEAYQENKMVCVLSARQSGKCFGLMTEITVASVKKSTQYNYFNINTIKKFILKIINRKLYDNIYKSV